MACSLGMKVAMMRTVRVAVVSEGGSIGWSPWYRDGKTQPCRWCSSRLERRA